MPTQQEAYHDLATRLDKILLGIIAHADTWPVVEDELPREKAYGLMVDMHDAFMKAGMKHQVSPIVVFQQCIGVWKQAFEDI